MKNELTLIRKIEDKNKVKTYLDCVVERSERSRGLTNIVCVQYTHIYIYDSTYVICVCVHVPVSKRLLQS